MMENLFKWVNYVILLRYLNMFLKNLDPQNIMLHLTPHILISKSPLKYDLSILAIVKKEVTMVREWRLDDENFLLVGELCDSNMLFKLVLKKIYNPEK